MGFKCIWRLGWDLFIFIHFPLIFTLCRLFFFFLPPIFRVLFQVEVWASKVLLSERVRLNEWMDLLGYAWNIMDRHSWLFPGGLAATVFGIIWKRRVSYGEYDNYEPVTPELKVVAMLRIGLSLATNRVVYICTEYPTTRPLSQVQYSMAFIQFSTTISRILTLSYDT